MRVASIALGTLTLILLVMVPVGGAPATLQKGSQAIYDLSISISFSPPLCEPGPALTAQSTIVCPMIVTIPSTVNITGTLGWTATNKSDTAVNLNVTRDLTISSDGTATPSLHIVRSFNESIDLATRIVSIMPFFMPEIDQALEMAQASQGISVPAGMNWNATVNAIEPAITYHPVVRTMWWVNGPLNENQTVQVLVFPTNVTGSTNVDLGSLGTHSAWTLVFKPRPLLLPQEMPRTSTIPINTSLQVVFTFNYSKNSDLLLSASADVHFGFLSALQVLCDPTMAVCTAGSTTTTIFRSSGLAIHAALTLTSITNLSLEQTVGSTSSSGSGTGSGSGSGGGTSSGTGSSGESGTGTGGGTGGTTGGGSSIGSGAGSGPSSGPGGRSGSGGGSGGGTGQGPSSGTGTGSNPGSSQQPKSPISSAVPAWFYWMLGFVVAAIIASGLWLTRRRVRRKTPNPAAQPID